MKENLSIILSVVALFGVLALGGLWACDVWRFSVVSLDSFVGVIVALLGLLITFAIGWQIINAMDIREKLKETEAIRLKVERQRENITELAMQTKSESLYILANTAYHSNDYVDTFRFAQGALWVHMQSENIANYDAMLTLIESCASKTSPKEEIPQNNYDAIKGMNTKMRELKNYFIIADRYDKAYATFMKKAVCATKKQL